MKVLHVIASIATRDGGPGSAATAMVRALVDAGHETLLVTTNFDGPGRRLPVPSGRQVDYGGIPIICFPMTGASEREKHSPALAKWLNRNVRSFDIVHIHGLFAHSTRAACESCRSSGVPYVIGPVGHLMAPNLAIRRGRLVNIAKQLYIRVIEQRNLDTSSGLVFTSTLERRLSSSHFSARMPTAIVPPCLSDGDFHSAQMAASRVRSVPRQPLRIGFLGRLDPIKGFDLWLPALGAARNASPPFELIIAGPHTAWSKDHLQTLLKMAGLGSQTQLAGEITGDARWEFLASLDLLVLCSQLENFGMVALEAAACGTPVLMTRNVGASGLILRACPAAGWQVPGRGDELQRAFARILPRLPARFDPVVLHRQFSNHRLARRLASFYHHSIAMESVPDHPTP